MPIRIATLLAILACSMIFMGQAKAEQWLTATATRVVLNTPYVPISTPLARVTPKVEPTDQPAPTNTPFLSIRYLPSVSKHFVVTPIPPSTAVVFVSCTNCTSIYYKYDVPYDVVRGYTFSGSTISVPAGTSLYTKPVVGWGKSCIPSSDERVVYAGYNRIPDFFCE